MIFSAFWDIAVPVKLGKIALFILKLGKNNTVILSKSQVDRAKRIWYLSPMRAAKVQASLRICAVLPEPSLLAHISSESRGTFRQKARSLAPLNGWTCAVKMCHDGMLENTNSLDGAQVKEYYFLTRMTWQCKRENYQNSAL